MNLGVFIFIVTSVVYVTQHAVNPKIANYVDALYFTITTLTTTGFGDITLEGPGGRLLAILIMFVGVGLFLRLLQAIFRPNKVRFNALTAVYSYTMPTPFIASTAGECCISRTRGFPDELARLGADRHRLCCFCRRCISFAGTASELSPNARLTGRASASADNLVAFVRALIAMAGQPQPPLPPLLAGRFRFDGQVELSPTMVSATDFTLALADDSGAGSLALELAPDLTVDARFTAPRARPRPLVGSPCAARQFEGGTGDHHACGRGSSHARRELAGGPHRNPRTQGRRGRLQEQSRPQHCRRASGAQRPRRRAEVHRQPTGRPRRSGEFHPVGRSVASDRIRQLQPGRAEAARDLVLA